MSTDNLIQAIWLVIWPIVIFLCYQAIKWILNNYEHKLENEE